MVTIKFVRQISEKSRYSKLETRYFSSDPKLKMLKRTQRVKRHFSTAEVTETVIEVATARHHCR